MRVSRCRLMTPHSRPVSPDFSSRLDRPRPVRSSAWGGINTPRPTPVTESSRREIEGRGSEGVVAPARPCKGKGRDGCQKWLAEDGEDKR